VTGLDVRPRTLDLYLYRGDTFTVSFTFTHPAPPMPVRSDEYVSYPLDGTWEAQIRTSPENPEVLADFTIDTSEQSYGEITISLDADTVTLLPARAWWDLQQTDLAGARKTWFRGNIAVTGDVTR
jgi:hypothetical protein